MAFRGDFLPGLHEMALEILFNLLDHPSWCGFGKPWELLRRCIKSVGTSSSFLREMWSLRVRTWKDYIFTCPDLSTQAKSVRNLLRRVHCGEDARLPDDNLILEVVPLKGPS